MSVCELFASADVELFFYDELDAVDRARVEMHLRSCEPCRQRLEDLHAIRCALASRPAVDAPPAGDWSGFMRRLDQNVAQTAHAPNPRTFESANHGTIERWNLRTISALAAMLALVTLGVILAARFRLEPATQLARDVPAARPPAPAANARPADWEYERTLAGTLLLDTRLYRQAALQGGVSDVERVMRDLETVLLEASMSDAHDRAALERVQRLITKRDLVVKMQVIAAAGPAGN